MKEGRRYTKSQMQTYTISQIQTYTISQMQTYTISQMRTYTKTQMQTYNMSQLKTFTIIYKSLVNKNLMRYILFQEKQQKQLSAQLKFNNKKTIRQW